KVLMDMPVTPEAGPHLRAAGHDEIHAVDLGLARSSDENCSRSHGARNESSLLPTWTIRASLHCSKPTVPASSCSAEARTLTERCLRCSTGSWPAPPHSASNTQSLSSIASASVAAPCLSASNRQCQSAGQSVV